MAQTLRRRNRKNSSHSPRATNSPGAAVPMTGQRISLNACADQVTNKEQGHDTI
jgi:hypothetical protein